MKIADHVDEDQLERYAMSRLTASERDVVEEHLLTCRGCRNRVENVDSLITGLRAADELLNSEPLKITHVTADGPIRLLAGKSEAGGWTASLSGEQIEAGQLFAELRDANEYLLRVFAELFPEHVCSQECTHNVRGFSRA